MTAPPRLAAWLLQHTLAPSDRDAVIGDLLEEFSYYMVPTRGPTLARWWYRGQVARSLVPLSVRAWERASLGRASMAVIGAALLTTVPAVLLLTLRSFVLQQVPLKTTSELSRGFALTLGLVVLLTGLVALAAAIRLLNTDRRER